MESQIPAEQENPRPWENLEELLDRNVDEDVQSFLNEMAPADAARCIERLDGDYRDRVLESLDAESAAELLEFLPDARGSELLENAAPGTAAAILEELPSDEQADMLASIGPESAASILAEMDPEAARAAADLAAYPQDTAGGLMVREFLAYQRNATVRAVIEDIRSRVDEIGDYEVQYIYVTEVNGTLTGVLRLRDLLLTHGSEAIERIMIAQPASVSVTTGLDELVDLFESKDFLGIPVVDEANRLVGLVHRSDVDDAWDERAEQSRLKAQGIVGGEELRSMPVLRRSRRRLSWLSINILLNVFAASVIAAYQDTLSQVIALAVFLPIISDMSGCSGNQAVAVSMRELTLGVLKPVDVFYVWRKELAVGALNALVLGVLLAAAAWIWKGNPMLGGVIGVALALNTLIAVSIGGIVPLVLKRFGMDPALASGPILTTLTDMCGFFLVLSLAAATMEHIV
ncbi:MAG: magnesium transporter [Planctomycetes bacterium]|nr:magnesium transporter [Planctomycetota bacterium]